MKSLKQTSYAAKTQIMKGVRRDQDGIKQPTPAPFQS